MDEIQARDVANRFTYHPPADSDQANKYVDIRTYSGDLALRFLALCPDSRERNIAITKIEEAVFWANASIARNE